MAEYGKVVWSLNKEDLARMLLQGVGTWINIRLIEEDRLSHVNRPLWARITSVRRDAVVDSNGFAFHVEGTVAMSMDETAEQIPFTGVLYSPLGVFPLNWSTIEFPEKPLVLDNA